MTDLEQALCAVFNPVDTGPATVGEIADYWDVDAEELADMVDAAECLWQDVQTYLVEQVHLYMEE